MSNYNQATCPPSGEPTLPPSQQQGVYAAPPPMGYPVRDGSQVGGDVSAPVQTQSKGDGFWRGCCAALCCCCLLDACV